MNELWNLYGPPERIDDETYSRHIPFGANITDAIDKAISVARDFDATIQFDFNATVSVRSDSNPKLIERDWFRAVRGYIKKNVGPYPNHVLTDAERENDARVEAENERKQRERPGYEARARAAREAAALVRCWKQRK